MFLRSTVPFCYDDLTRDFLVGKVNVETGVDFKGPSYMSTKGKTVLFTCKEFKGQLSSYTLPTYFIRVRAKMTLKKSTS